MVSRRVQALLDQLRAQGIQDELVLNALAAVPREKFVDEALNKSLGQYRLADRSGADNFAAVYGGANDRITRADAAVAGAGKLALVRDIKLQSWRILSNMFARLNGLKACSGRRVAA